MGLGRAIAERLSRAGAALTIVDLEPVLANANVPATWSTLAVDLAAADAESRLRALADDPAALDILVANAGIVPPWRRIDELDREEWQHVFAVNVWGAALCMKTLSTSLARSSHASIIVMASINGYRADPNQALYTASKHAIIGLMRAAALDLGRQGIRVNALAPGPVTTSALLARVEARHQAGGPAPQQALDAMSAQTALKRMATAEMVADAALYLASEQSAGTTGTVLPVECGLG